MCSHTVSRRGSRLMRPQGRKTPLGPRASTCQPSCPVLGGVRDHKPVHMPPDRSPHQPDSPDKPRRLPFVAPQCRVKGPVVLGTHLRGRRDWQATGSRPGDASTGGFAALNSACAHTRATRSSPTFARSPPGSRAAGASAVRSSAPPHVRGLRQPSGVAPSSEHVPVHPRFGPETAVVRSPGASSRAPLSPSHRFVCSLRTVGHRAYSHHMFANLAARADASPVYEVMQLPFLTRTGRPHPPHPQPTGARSPRTTGPRHSDAWCHRGARSAAPGPGP